MIESKNREYKRYEVGRGPGTVYDKINGLFTKKRESRVDRERISSEITGEIDPV